MQMDSCLAMATAALITTCCVAGSLPSQTSKLAADDQTISEQSFATWREWLRPKTQETAWSTTIPWLPSFAEGIHRADEQARPLLLWVMNGHPLGCT